MAAIRPQEQQQGHRSTPPTFWSAKTVDVSLTDEIELRTPPLLYDGLLHSDAYQRSIASISLHVVKVPTGKPRTIEGETK